MLGGDRPPYDEAAAPAPVNRYGAAKAAAEAAVSAVHPGAVIVRTSVIVGHGSKNERRVHDLARSGRGGLFSDVHRMPVHVDELAAALLEVIDTSHVGVLNLAGADRLSYAELGALVAARDGLDPARIPTRRASESGVAIARDLTLDLRLARQLLRTRLRGAREFWVPGGA